MSVPKYALHDIVYLTESAKVGFLESYEISGIRQDSTGAWLYQISVPQRPPTGTATYGDRITLRHSIDFELAEQELTVYCEAVDFALVAARANLNRLQQLKASHCTDTTATGTEPGTGSGTGSGTGTI